MHRRGKSETVIVPWLALVLLALTVSCQSAPVATTAPASPTASPYPFTPTAVPQTKASPLEGAVEPMVTRTSTTVPSVVSHVSAPLTVRVPRSTPGTLPQATVRVGNLDRTYAYYIPANLRRNAPLLLAFHGAGGSGENMRQATGYEFESLADKNGFIVAYPDGYQNSWNDCRRSTPLGAKKEDIDDLGFIRGLIAQVQKDYAINPSQVFAVGLSNGAHFNYRLAVELNDQISAVAVVAANFSQDDDSVCRVSGKPIPVLIMNGTSDPLNPYEGGVANFKAHVRSAQETAEYFAQLNGQSGPGRTVHLNGSGPISVDRTVWNDLGKPEVVLIKINGGGHAVPQFSWYDGPAAIWDFFSSQNPLD